MVADPIDTFRALHGAGCFILPNPWDRGSARALASLGFRALATTSAGLAFSHGRADAPDALDVDVVLANIREIVDATSLPVNADFQDGYAAGIDALIANITRCVGLGVAGLSIEDATGDPACPLYPLDVAVERVRAARAAIDATGRGVVLTARAECFLVGAPDPLAQSLRRLVAFADAGADCLYAPGLRTPEAIAAVVRAVAPKPVNVLAVDPSWMTLDALAELGVRRISIGSAFARVAWAALLRSASAVATTGDFASLAEATPFAALNELFAAR